MADPSQIKKKLREVVGLEENLPITATVKEVQSETCTVVLAGGLELTGVRLKATINDGNNFLVTKPRIGSKVLMLSINGGLENLVVVKVDQVDSISYSGENGLQVIIDGNDGKVAVQNNTVSLVEVLTLLSSLLKVFKVNTPSGPSTNIMPDTLASIIDFETKFNQLLKAV